MSKPMPAIGDAVGLAYRDLATVSRVLGRLTGLAFVIVIVGDQAERLVGTSGTQADNAQSLAVFLIELVQTLLLTPYLIAIHRFIVLGETTPSYVLAIGERRTQVYFLCWAALSVALMAPGFLPAWPAPDKPAASFVALIVLAYLIAVMVFALRASLLFPAIAVDAPGASLAHALADAKGHLWRIFATGVIGAAPVVMAGYLLQRLAGSVAGGDIVGSLVRTIASFVVLTQFMAIVSRLYLWLGERLERAE